MELRYVLITLLKILISTPTILLTYKIHEVQSAALMGGHLDNKSYNATNITDNYYEYDINDSQDIDEEHMEYAPRSDNSDSEEIPDPSPLVLPGYNLPENIFNHGKPFYGEKDPLTGQIDFNHKSPSIKEDDDLYDYVDEKPSDNIYDKANIDRKDGSLGSHRPSDVNQLTPNFHDFLNLPVKYNPDKYVYPLISSSYASTKVQGSVNKFHNHKDYKMKTTTRKPMGSPTYHSTNNQYFNPSKTTAKIMTTTTTTQRPTTIKMYPEIHLTTKPTNLMDSDMSHPSFNEEFDYYDITSSTIKPKPSNIYLTTENVNNIYLTSKVPSTTTKKPMSLFEQLFGDYDETVPTMENTRPPPLFTNLPSNIHNKNKYDTEVKTEKPSYTTSTATTNYGQYPNAHAGPNVLTGTSMGLDSNYDYEEDYSTGKYEDNVAVESKPVKSIEDDLKIEPLDKKIVENKTHNNTSSHFTASKIERHNNTEYYAEYEKVTTTTNTTTTTSKPKTTTATRTTTIPTITVRVTSLPLGENHVTNSNLDSIGHDPIIVATQNLREKLNSEKVLPKPFEKPMQSVVTHSKPPSTSNIHIAPDQDTVSFVVGHHQNVDGGQYVGTSLKESPYDSNPFRPLYGQQATYNNNKDSVSYTIQASPEGNLPPHPSTVLIQPYPELVGSAVTIQPLKNSEASLAIGVPVNGVKQIPGQVVDEKLEINNNPIEFPKGSGSKIVFPNEKEPEYPDLIPPPRQPIHQPVQQPQPNREVLKLSSKPMYHQLPSDLTPPKEKDTLPPPRQDHRPIRPPWDPRPGHFYSGKPEYNRPPRPPPEMAYKRIDNLPNILPQFRPNMNKHIGPPSHFYDNRMVRQPLLERPSNRPIGFFEKLQPPPPPFSALKNLQNLRKIPSPAPPKQSLGETQIAEDRIINEGPTRAHHQSDQFDFFKTPPQVKIANRRNGEDTVEIETLQMIQAKNAEKEENNEKGPSHTVSQTVNIPSAEDHFKDNTGNTIYKVYPVNTPPIKLDIIDNNKKESVVIGTRAELPLPPSKINKDFVYDQNPLFDTKDRNDAPILKPHPRPPTFPFKSDFPYPLERPDPSVIHPAVPETPSNNGNGLEETPNNKYYTDESMYLSSNQWNTLGENIESRIVNGHKINAPNSNQISVTLRTYTEKPIAVAYTPTEPNLNADKYSMPNYGSPVIPEIRPGTVENADNGHGHSDNEFTVSAVMHTHPQPIIGKVESIPIDSNKRMDVLHDRHNHKTDSDIPDYSKLDFQAPFQASANIDQSMSQGWSVVKEKNKTVTEPNEHTTLPYALTSEFDIENFKPQLEGGFKPIYNFPDSKKKVPESEVNEREE